MIPQLLALNDQTIWVDTTNYIRLCFLKNNPWKLSDKNDIHRVFRNCILCNKQRFPDQEWNKERVTVSLGSSSLFCSTCPRNADTNKLTTLLPSWFTTTENPIPEGGFEQNIPTHLG